MVLFTAVSQDNGIKSKQTKFNWPTNYKTYQYYTPLFKKRFPGKKNVPYFPCIHITHCVVQWQSTVLPSHTFCVHSDQTKCSHFYFLRPKLVKATNMVHNMSNTRTVQWYLAHIYPTTAACRWHQLTVFTWNLPRFIELIQYFVISICCP
jgi:hypothetical protein